MLVRELGDLVDGCHAPVDVSAWTTATSFGLDLVLRAPPRSLGRRRSRPTGPRLAVRRAGPLGDLGHARPEDAVHADDDPVSPGSSRLTRPPPCPADPVPEIGIVSGFSVRRRRGAGPSPRPSSATNAGSRCPSSGVDIARRTRGWTCTGRGRAGGARVGQGCGDLGRVHGNLPVAAIRWGNGPTRIPGVSKARKSPSRTRHAMVNPRPSPCVSRPRLAARVATSEAPAIHVLRGNCLSAERAWKPSSKKREWREPRWWRPGRGAAARGGLPRIHHRMPGPHPGLWIPLVCVSVRTPTNRCDREVPVNAPQVPVFRPHPHAAPRPGPEHGPPARAARDVDSTPRPPRPRSSSRS